jgi:hypothetical protein
LLEIFVKATEARDAITSDAVTKPFPDTNPDYSAGAGTTAAAPAPADRSPYRATHAYTPEEPVTAEEKKAFIAKLADSRSLIQSYFPIRTIPRASKDYIKMINDSIERKFPRQTTLRISQSAINLLNSWHTSLKSLEIYLPENMREHRARLKIQEGDYKKNLKTIMGLELIFDVDTLTIKTGLPPLIQNVAIPIKTEITRVIREARNIQNDPQARTHNHLQKMSQSHALVAQTIRKLRLSNPQAFLNSRNEDDVNTNFKHYCETAKRYASYNTSEAKESGVPAELIRINEQAIAEVSKIETIIKQYENSGVKS